jgi:hypothetical protein
MEFLYRRRTLRMLMERLRNDPVVERVKYYCRHIRVIFKDGLSERWYHREYGIMGKYTFFIPRDPLEGGNIQIQTQHSVYDTDTKPLLYLDYKKFKKASFYNQRIAIHRLVIQLYNDGFTKIICTPEELYEDLLSVNESDYSRMVKNGTFTITGVYEQPGRKLVSQFTDWNDAVKEKWTQRNIYTATAKAFRRFRHATRHNVIRYIAQKISHKYISPAYYNIFFRIFNVHNCLVLDPYPSPSKAIAATLLRCKYQSPNLYPELAKFMGVKFFPVDNAHILVLDYNLRSGDWLNDLKIWGKMADIALVCSENIIPGASKYVQYRFQPMDKKPRYISVIRMKK